MNMQNEHDMEFQILHPLTDAFVMQKRFKLVSRTLHETYYSPRYSIPQFPPEHTMVNVFQHWCCGNQSGQSDEESIMYERLTSLKQRSLRKFNLNIENVKIKLVSR